MITKITSDFGIFVWMGFAGIKDITFALKVSMAPVSMGLPSRLHLKDTVLDQDNKQQAHKEGDQDKQPNAS